jgi:hypothetical protein
VSALAIRGDINSAERRRRARRESYGRVSARLIAIANALEGWIVVTPGIGCSAEPDAFDPCVPIPGSKGSAINQVGITPAFASPVVYPSNGDGLGPQSPLRGLDLRSPLPSKRRPKRTDVFLTLTMATKVG